MLAVLAMTPLAPSTRAEPARVALVIGNAVYAALPAISACARSANAVSAALRNLDFDVIERQDASIGGIDAGIGEFSQRIADGKTAAFVYVCGYGARFNDRTFLLPISARVARPSDVLTQGVLLKSLLDTLARTNGPAIVALDVIPKPDEPVQIGLEALADFPMPDGTGLVAITEVAPRDGPTPAANALVSGLSGPEVRTDILLGSIQSQLTSGNATVAALRMPARSGFLAGAPPPAPEPPKPPPVPPVISAVTPPTVEQLAPLPPVAAVAMPDEDMMTNAERREMQTALARMGYYAAQVDGVIGSETRAAIRRYQHEIGAGITGRLTAAQASRLVSTR
jgi:hypothetical protein